ncbi:MAG: protein translocase subunit SecD, partial [Acidimicrobiales bacterium]|nr:protein translocase subunit SecD [Acidimicrobiales bacterium]
MNRARWVSLIGITALAIAGLVYTFVAGNEPVLGIQLQGGASVVLTPTEDPPDGALEDAIEIIRRRVDGLGVAEPEISRQGDNILVELPGVTDQQRAIEIVQSVAKLEFRPVLGSIDEISFLLQTGQPLP